MNLLLPTDTSPSGSAARPARRVLVVDDSRVQRKILTAQLSRWGYEVLNAENAEIALRICIEQAPEMILSDWMMPGMNGVDFCKTIRASESGKYTYFILLTSKSDKAEIALGLEAGADDFLTKPVDGHELRARIRAGERILDMQSRLTDQNRALGEALREVERLNDALDNDLREARQLQQSLLPERHRSFGAFSMSLLLQSSGYVGGDLVGFFPAGENHLGMYAIDVSGHGISAALMTARLAGFLSPVAPDHNVALRQTRKGRYEPVPPAEAIATLNTLVLEEMETEHYFTMLLGDLDMKTGRLRIAQAGHPHPLLQRADGPITQTSPGGFPVGLMGDAVFAEFEIQMQPGDRLLFHSDGIMPGPGRQDAGGGRARGHHARPARHERPRLLRDLHVETDRFRRRAGAAGRCLGGPARLHGLTDPPVALQVHAVAAIAQGGNRVVYRQPKCFVIGFGWSPRRPHRPGNVDVAQLFGPEVVFRHEDEPAECAQAARRGNPPPGLLQNLSMQRRKRGLARIDPATRKLDVRHVVPLYGQQHLTAARQDGIGSRAQAIPPAGLWRRIDTGDHGRTVRMGFSF